MAEAQQDVADGSGVKMERGVVGGEKSVGVVAGLGRAGICTAASRPNRAGAR